MRRLISGFGKEPCKISGGVSSLYDASRRESEFFGDGWGYLIEAKFIVAWSRDEAHLQDLHLVCFLISLPKPDRRLSSHPAFPLGDVFVSVPWRE